MQANTNIRYGLEFSEVGLALRAGLTVIAIRQAYSRPLAEKRPHLPEVQTSMDVGISRNSAVGKPLIFANRR
jgi:hypothetical protein